MNKLIVFIIFLICSAIVNGQQANEPVADPKAIVTAGQVRFTMLTPQLIRMEWSETNKFTDNASFVFINRRLTVPAYRTGVENGWLFIQTDYLYLKYKLNSGSFSSENLSIDFSKSFTLQKDAVWKPGMKDTGNLFGTIRTLDGVNGAINLDPGILSRDGWTVIDDSERPLYDNSDWQWVIPAQPGKKQDLYFFGYGHNYKQQLYDFTLVAGKIPLPPRFAFGTWWSRYWNYTDEELYELVNQFNTFDVPLEVLVVDMDWHNTYQEKWDWGKLDQAGTTIGWTGYSWNRNYFPAPDSFLSWTETEGLKVTLNLHPASGIQPYEDRYVEMAKAMGVDPSSKKYIPFDITDKKFAENYFNVVIHPLEKQGVDFWWLDWQQWHTTPIPGVTPTWWINYVFFTDMERQNKRALLFHRWGGLGNHRYQVGFSGDTHSTWESLAFQPYFTSTASNVGFGYWSHDIGGHMPGVVSPELYTRWIQFGVFSPILRTHSAKNPLAERRIWGYPYENFIIMREAYLLRYSLIPYIYTAAREAYNTGISMCRPMYYEYPDKNEAYDFKEQYMFGRDMLISPVASPVDTVSKLAQKQIWLPEGDWYEWYTGTMVKGPKILTRNFALDEIPVYVKSGSIIPMQAQHESAEKMGDTLMLTIFPGDSGSTKTYEDDGSSPDYKLNSFSYTTLSHINRNGSQIITILPAEGKYEGMSGKRTYRIVLEGTLPPKKVSYNGKEVSWKYDGNNLKTIFSLPEFRADEKVEIIVEHPSEKLFEIVNGFAGKVSRLKKVKNVLDSKWPGVWNLSELISAAQTGRRISLDNSTAVKELKDFNNNLTKVKEKFKTLELTPAEKNYLLLPLEN